MHDRIFTATLCCLLGAGASSAQTRHDDAGGGPDGGPGGQFGWFVGSNAEWRSQVVPEDFDPAAGRASDCWGYASGSGREYAIIGLDTGLGFVEVTDPLRPVIVHFEPGAYSPWRDIKVFGTFAYAVSEAETGLEVFDLSQIDTGLVARTAALTGNGTDLTHNVVIDTDSGYLYRVGGGSGPTGLRVYDLNGDAANPTYVGQWSGNLYIHDAQAVTYTTGPYAGREIVFACGGQDGGWTDPSLHIIDVTDKQNIFPIASLGYAGAAYAHQGWLGEDRSLFYLNDELDEQSFGFTTRTRVFDVTDLASPAYLGHFSNGNSATDHNLYAADGMLFAANYRSGLRVFDASADPTAPSEVAWLDTFRLDDIASTTGAWSNYPYLPSGSVLISDVRQGLIVARLTVDRVDLSLPLGEPVMLDPAGGTVLAVRIASHGLTPDLAATRLHVDAGQGEVLIAPEPTGQQDIYEFTLPGGVCGGSASVWLEAPSVEGPVFTLPARAPVEVHTVPFATEASEPYAEDFETAQGWTVSGNAQWGHWEFAEPINNGMGDPPFDFDMSGRCALTWNLDEDSDVDNGRTILTSPVLDASLGGALEFAAWLDGGDFTTGDGLFVELSTDGGSTWTRVKGMEEPLHEWRTDAIDLDDQGAASPTLRIRFIAIDTGPDSTVEAAIDAVAYQGFGCGCLADLNGDGDVDTLDFLAYLNAWASGDSAADWNGDGRVDTLDFLAFLNDWATGC